MPLPSTTPWPLSAGTCRTARPTRKSSRRVDRSEPRSLSRGATLVASRVRYCCVACVIATKVQAIISIDEMSVLARAQLSRKWSVPCPTSGSHGRIFGLVFWRWFTGFLWCRGALLFDKPLPLAGMCFDFLCGSVLRRKFVPPRPLQLSRFTTASISMWRRRSLPRTKLPWTTSHRRPPCSICSSLAWTTRGTLSAPSSSFARQDLVAYCIRFLRG